MAAESDGLEHGAGTAASVDSSAINTVLLGMSREKADALGEQQIKVAIAQEEVLRLQAEELKKEDKLRHWSLRVRHTIDVLKVSFSLFVALVGLVLAAGFGTAIWSAAHDNGLVIESFSVPRDFSERGLTGQVIASQVLDKLAALQAETDSSRAANSYANNWGNDIKVQIPEAGISVGELNRYLRAWLGHETHVTGELFRTVSGIAITARSGSDAGQTLLASETELDSLIQRTAEAIYRRTQPYRYGRYLEESGRFEEAAAVFQDLALLGTPREQGWGLAGLAGLKFESGSIQAARDLAKRAVALDPDNAFSLYLLGFYESDVGNPEAALNAYKTEIALLQKSNGELSGAGAAARKEDAIAAVAGLTGDYRAQLDMLARYRQQDSLGPQTWIALAIARCNNHEPTRALSVQRPPTSGLLARIDAQLAPVELAAVRASVAMERDDWRTYVKLARFIEQNGAQVAAYKGFVIPRIILPAHATALARLGLFIEAHSLIERTPADCYYCIQERARIYALEGNVGGASFWFARAVHDSPSSPFAYSNWGEVLMHRGDFDGAIAKFTLANQKGPHFADPLEMWGEALMFKNRSDLALAKFEDANKYAPNWGRLHMKWGEALGYVGRKDDARAQYLVASTLDLSVADKAELARDKRGS